MVDLSKNSHAAACRHSHYSVFRLLNEALWDVLGKIWKLTNYLDITCLCVKNAVPNLYTTKLECVPNRYRYYLTNETSRYPSGAMRYPHCTTNFLPH